MTNNKFDVIIIGGGPIGLACALELQKAGFSYLVIEKGSLVNSIYNFPSKMTFFTYNYDIAIGGVPFASDPTRPTRQEALAYYRNVVTSHNLNVNLYEKVINIEGSEDNFTVQTELSKSSSIKNSYKCRKIFVATGYYDNPNFLNIPGEELGSHYYTDPHEFYNQHVVIIGGGNSAAEAALDLFRHEVKVTIIHRGSKMRDTIKYWVKPDIEGRIRDKQITAYFNSIVKEIKPHQVIFEQKGNTIILGDVDYTFILTGYHPDYTLIKQLGVQLLDNGAVVMKDEESRETTVDGIYILGSAAHGDKLNKIFIENGRFEAKKAVDSLISASNQANS